MVTIKTPQIETSEGTKEEFRKVKKVVLELLKDHPANRGDDKILIQQTVYRMTKHMIPIEVLKKAPSFETITRVRRKIQEKGQYLPTDTNTYNQRQERQEEIKGIMKLEEL